MIDEAQIEAIVACLAEAGGSGDVESLLRGRFPELRLTFCSSDDIQVRRPVKRVAGYEIYLYAGDHCLTLSNDYQAAHGVVVASIEDDDEEE